MIRGWRAPRTAAAAAQQERTAYRENNDPWLPPDPIDVALQVQRATTQLAEARRHPDHNARLTADILEQFKDQESYGVDLPIAVATPPTMRPPEYHVSNSNDFLIIGAPLEDSAYHGCFFTAASLLQTDVWDARHHGPRAVKLAADNPAFYLHRAGLEALKGIRNTGFAADVPESILADAALDRIALGVLLTRGPFAYGGKMERSPEGRNVQRQEIIDILDGFQSGYEGEVEMRLADEGLGWLVDDVTDDLLFIQEDIDATLLTDPHAPRTLMTKYLLPPQSWREDLAYRRLRLD